MYKNVDKLYRFVIPVYAYVFILILGGIKTLRNTLALPAPSGVS